MKAQVGAGRQKVSWWNKGVQKGEVGRKGNKGVARWWVASTGWGGTGRGSPPARVACSVYTMLWSVPHGAVYRTR